MIIEARDIVENKVAYAHTRPPPPDVTLGEVLDFDPKLKTIKPYIVQVRLNGRRHERWETLTLGRTDRLEIDIMPGWAAFIAPIIAYVTANATTIAAITSAVVSVIGFIVSMVTRPKPPKQDGLAKDSPTYSFEGVKTSYSPGGPVQVNYGEALAGGQLLSLAIDVNVVGLDNGSTSGTQQQLSMLIGLGHGVITDVSCVKVNGVPVEHLAAPGQDTKLTWEWRPGYSSQSLITGFEKVRNTYADGREIVSETSIIYNTLGTSIDGVELQVAALDGLGIYVGQSSPHLNYENVAYRIEYQLQGAPSWSPLLDRQFNGATTSAKWDKVDLDFGSRAAWALRLSYLANWPLPRNITETAMSRIWLKNVTETIQRDALAPSYSGTALLAVKAIATAQLQGGPPTITAMVKGLRVKAYSDDVTYITTYTANPAWCLLDYLTNSYYGMGAFITGATAVDLQSFRDFATICNTLVQDGLGNTETQHRLDLIMDKKKPHWAWVNDILGLYRSAMIYSQGKFKLITERDGLPVRQVFHAGNIIPQTFQMTMGAADPIKPNQATVTFPNKDKEYSLDTLYVQDASVVANPLTPIKEFEMSLLGIARESEAIREAHWQLSKRREVAREVKFKTGLEALAVEPGDLCAVGIPVTNFDLGYGGRVYDGSNINYLILDREVALQRNTVYDMYLWHTASDSVEVRQLFEQADMVTAVCCPTNPFNLTPVPSDRWAIGVNSEDLMVCWVKKTSRDDAGLHEITGERYVPLSPVTPERFFKRTRRYFGDVPPAQPIDARAVITRGTQFDGTLVAVTMIDLVQAPQEEGGQLSSVTAARAVLIGSHAPVTSALVNDDLQFLTGTASGQSCIITSYTIAAGLKFADYAPALSPAPSSGDRYQISHASRGDLAGFDVYESGLMLTTSVAFNYRYTALGTHEEHVSDLFSGQAVYRLVPFSSRGVRNNVGCWELTSVNCLGDFMPPAQPSGLEALATIRGNFLDWNRNTEPDLRGYELFRNTTNAFGTSSLVVGLGANAYLDVDVTVANTYYYWVRAMDRVGNESPIYPGSTDGVYAVAIPANHYAEYVNTNSIQLGAPIPPVVVASLGVNVFGGNILVQGLFSVLANSASAQGAYNGYLEWLNPAGSYFVLDTRRVTVTPSGGPSLCNLVGIVNPGSSFITFRVRADHTFITGGTTFIQDRKMTVFEALV